MDVVLTKELEKIVQQQVKTGLYADADEVIRNAIRHTYCSSEPDPYLDSPEMAEKVREALRGKYVPHDPRNFKHILDDVVSRRK
jgi:hypothetical protein